MSLSEQGLYIYQARISNEKGINDDLHKITSVKEIHLMDKVRVMFSEGVVKYGQVVGKTSDNNYLTILLDIPKYIDCNTE